MGSFDAALNALVRVPPEGRDWWLLRGACLARLRRAPEAVEALRKVLELDPDCHEALTWMAILRRVDPEEALGYARRAIALLPEDASGHGALGTLLLGAGKPEEAIAALERAIELAPDVAEHRHNLALAFLRVHQHSKAVEELRRAISLAPRSPQNYLLLASTYSQFGRAGEAIECLSEGLKHLPDHAPFHSAVAGAYASLRNEAAAERHHRRALALAPESRGTYGAWLLNQGRFEESNAIFEAMLRDGSDPAFAFYGLMQGRKTADDGLLSQMESLRGLRPRSEMYLRYALGRAEEGRGRYGEAMAHFDAANRLAEGIYHGGRPTDPGRFAREFEEVRGLFESLSPTCPPHPALSPLGGRGFPDAGTEPAATGVTVEGEGFRIAGRDARATFPGNSPIFIIGMIRSGTTLLDQIVSSHSWVASGGELRFWMEEAQRLLHQKEPDLEALAEEYVSYARLLAGPEPVFTDKMPLNFTVAGIIHAAMPGARFLHIRRHPIDTCLSIWTTFFGQGPLFAYDKANIVAYYRHYLRTMDYWRSVLPSDRLLELDYEDLIADPEPTIRRVIEFCGLPWDDACLRHDQNAGAIHTPSRWQARQPIYRSSVERWRRYEGWLGEFKELGGLAVGG